MKFLKGAMLGAALTAGVMMAGKDMVQSERKKMMKAGRKIAKKIKMMY